MLDHTSSLANLDKRSFGTLPDRGQFISYADIVSFIRCNLRTLAGCPVVTLIGVIAYLGVTDPIFTARAQILIDPRMPQLLREQSGEVNVSLDNGQVESDIAVLRSEKIAMIVINELDLSNDPEFQNQKPSIFGMLRSVFAGRDASDTNASGAKEPTSDKGMLEYLRSRRAIAAFEAGLDVRRTGLSYAIEIAFSSRDPDKAARVANATAEAYIRDQVETKSETARLGSEWLERRLAQLRAQLNAATEKAQAFRAKHDYRIRTRTDKSDEPERQATDGPPGSTGDYTLEELETTAKTYRKIYESYLQGFTASVQRQSFPVPDARIITPATRPLTKSRPRTFLTLAFGGLLGLMIGLGISVIRHSLDRSLRFSRQIRDELGLECIGRLPRLAGAAGHLEEAAKTPFSNFSACLRTAKTIIGLAMKTRSIRCIGITSTLPKEGKSTVVSNLATLFSKSGMRTLVVDADFANRTLTRVLAPDATAGSIETAEDGRIKDQIVPVANVSFDLLPATRNANDILGSESMHASLKNIFQAYDIVIFDVPPANPAVDWIALTPLLDAVAVVAEWGRTPLDLLSEMLRSFRMADISILGVIMTKADDGSVAGPGKDATRRRSR